MTRKTTLKARLRHYYAQRGKSNVHADVMRLAKKVGWRRSENGNWYFEDRKNRSDRNRRKRL